jgi:ankyrin repeat protein
MPAADHPAVKLDDLPIPILAKMFDTCCPHVWLATSGVNQRLRHASLDYIQSQAHNDAVLFLAVEAGHLEAVRRLLAHGANPHARQAPDQPLILTVSERIENRDAMVALLLQHTDMSKKTHPTHQPLLFSAASRDAVWAVVALLKAGADATAVYNSYTALHYLVRGRGEVATARALVTAGCDPSAA